MRKSFTREGLALKQRRIKSQEAKVRAIGKEVGAEAGISHDWHDNAGYEDAQRRLELESRILKGLTEEVAGAHVIDVAEQSAKVMIGNTVKLRLGDEPKEVTIGAYGESEPNKSLIAYTSPLAQALLGLSEGDQKTSTIGGRSVPIEIEAIYPPSYRYHQVIAELLAQEGLPTDASAERA